MTTKKEKANTFSMQIEQIVKDNNMSYMDALLFYGDENKLESETIASMVSSKVKAKLRVEAEELHFFPKTAKLPI